MSASTPGTPAQSCEQPAHWFWPQYGTYVADGDGDGVPDDVGDDTAPHVLSGQYTQLPSSSTAQHRRYASLVYCALFLLMHRPLPPQRWKMIDSA